jgi:hypothetical protein
VIKVGRGIDIKIKINKNREIEERRARRGEM